MPGQSHPRTEDIELLKNDVRIECLSAPELLIEHHIQRTIIDFCERSQIWQEDVGPIQIIAGIDTYEVSASRRERVVQVKEVYAENDSGDLVQFEYGQNLCSWSWYHDGPYNIEGRQLIVVAALTPQLYNGQFRFSRMITDEYFDAIATGAKARILAVPGKDWTNPQMAGAYSARYEQALNSALVRAGRDHARIPHRVAPKARSYF
jgi:hypothetical protein